MGLPIFPSPTKPTGAGGTIEGEFTGALGIASCYPRCSMALVGELVAALPGALGLVHGAIGFYEQFVGESFPGRGEVAAGDADAGADAQPLFGEHVDLSDRRQNRFGDGNCIGLAMDQFHEDHELVAADPCKGVSLANPASHALGDLVKQAVPRLVAERVVDRFEAVDVEKKQPDLASAPCRSGKHLRQTFTEVRPVGELGQLVLPRKPRDFLDLLRQKAVRSRNPPEENRSIDGICNQTEDDRGTEERVLLPIGACGEVPDHAENRDGGREKQVVTPEAQPPPHRREEKEPYVGGETAPEIRNGGAHEVVPQELETPPCVRRCGTLVSEHQISERVQREHDRRADDAVGETGEASHHQEAAESYDSADHARLRLAQLDAAGRIRAQPVPERQKPVQKSPASSRNFGGSRVHVFPLSTGTGAHWAPEARPRQVRATFAVPTTRGSVSPIALRSTASAMPSNGVASALTITTRAPAFFAAGTAPAIG